MRDMVRVRKHQNWTQAQQHTCFSKLESLRGSKGGHFAELLVVSSGSCLDEASLLSKLLTKGSCCSASLGKGSLLSTSCPCDSANSSCRDSLLASLASHDSFGS